MASGVNRATWVIVGAIVLAILVVVFLPNHRLKANAVASMGLTEAEVVSKLGAPFAVVTAAEAQASPQWWGAGWQPAPNRPVTNKVLLYYASITGALIYIGASGKVEHVHVVGT
jgi:ABC-type transport system involved in cytochrome c biogenesis permease subunit